MPVTMESLLGFAPLMQAIKEVESGVPKPLPPAFYAVRPTDRIVGDRAKNFRYSGNRKPARIAPYGAPPRQVSLLGRSVQDIVLLHTIENVRFRQEFLRVLLDWKAGSYTAQTLARTEILEQTMEFRTRFDVLRTACVHNNLAAAGKLYFDSAGNLLPNSSGAATIIDQGVPAGNIGTLLDSAGAVIVGASWATDTTDIPGHLIKVKKRALQLTGTPLRYAFYGENIPGYLLKNTFVKQYFSFNVGVLNAFQATGRPPGDMFELVWLPGYMMFNENDSGTIQEPFPADQITFAPEPAPDTYGVMEGSYIVPKSFQPEASMDAALGNLDMAYGMFEYAKVLPWDLPNAEFIGGDTMLPWLKRPNCYFFMDTTP